MSDKKFRELQKEIKETQNKLRILQQLHRKETGKNLV